MIIPFRSPSRDIKAEEEETAMGRRLTEWHAYLLSCPESEQRHHLEEGEEKQQQQQDRWRCSIA